jgi:hypothetical protein
MSAVATDRKHAVHVRQGLVNPEKKETRADREYRTRNGQNCQYRSSPVQTRYCQQCNRRSIVT